MATPRYLTVAGFRERLESGGGPDPSADQSIPTHWTNEQLGAFIVDAESELESRVRSRYTVPLPVDPVPPVVMNLVTAIAAYHAMLAMRKNRDFEGELDPYLLRYRWATDLLDRIADGRADIPGAGDGFPAEVFDPMPGRLFGPEHFGIGRPGAEGAERRTTTHWPYSR